MKPCAIVVVVGLAGCSQPGLKGSGKAKAEARPVTGFTAVDASGAVDVEIANGPEPRVEVTGDDNLVPLIDTQSDGSRLVIRNRESVRPVVPLVVRIAAPRISAVTVSGATTVTMHGARDELTVHGDGAATLHGDGAVRQLTVDASGACTLDLDQLTAERARVESSSAATVSVDVTRALDVRVSGAATVNYRGDPPELKRDVSTAGTLTKR